MDKRRGSGQTPALKMPVRVIRRRFTLDGEGVAVGLVRRWLRGALPASCAARDDMQTAVSELATNAAQHGGGGLITLVAEHQDGRLRGRLIHHRPPVGDLLPRWDAVAQTSRLLLGESVNPEDLVEDSRGLLMVWHLAEDFAYRPHDGYSVTEWTLSACGCGGAL